MEFYICLVIIVFLLLFWEKKYYITTRQIICVLLICFISVFRFDVGHDYPSYYTFLWPKLDENVVQTFAPLSQVLFYIADYFRSPGLLFVLYGLLTYFCVFSTIRKYSQNISISIVVYLFISWLFSLGEIRQALAIAIMFWGYRYVESKSLIKFFLVSAIAVLFHTSAIFALPIYFIYNHHKLWWYIPLLVILPLLQPLFFDILIENELYKFYLESDEDFEGGSMMKLFYLFLFLFFLFLNFISKKANKEIDNKFLYIIGFSTLFPFLFIPVLSMRVVHYYTIYYCLLIPGILSNYKLKTRALVIAFLMVYFILNIYIASLNRRSSYTPYQMIFFIEQPTFRW